MRTELGDGFNNLDESNAMMGGDPESSIKRSKADQRAAVELTFDYYETFPTNQPKFEIGQYVTENGFNVPLINTLAEWQKAFDDGTAMLRSEMPQDYDGLSGLLSSERLSESPLLSETSEIPNEIGRLIMQKLRNDELDVITYMESFRVYSGRVNHNWENEKVELISKAAKFGALDLLRFWRESASHWRYVEGTNVSVFADPNVEGRYHFGVTPFDFKYIGDCQANVGEYDTPKKIRLHPSLFIARPFIEYYEQIRNLPRFDNTQCPVVELQRGIDGSMCFLQYLKTGQKKFITEAFDLPCSNDTFRATDVRGVTLPKGNHMRLYIAPSHLNPEMKNQAIYCEGRGLEVQLASKFASFILQDDKLSFKDDHSDASPLYRPPLAASIHSYAKNSSILQRSIDDAKRRGQLYAGSPYIDIKVTSNGYEAAIESDWIIRY